MKLNKTSIKFYELTNDDEGKIVLTPAGEIENKPARSRELVAEIERLRDLLAKSIRREEIIEAENERLKAALEKIMDGDYEMGEHEDIAYQAIKGRK